MKIDKIIVAIILAVLFITSCDKDNQSNQSDEIEGTWKVTNISGGFAGIDDDYASGVITWKFNGQTLTVINNESQGAIYSGFETGTYQYTSTEINGVKYININSQEFGGYTITNNNLTINQNETSTGSGADGFILNFSRQ